MVGVYATACDPGRTRLRARRRAAGARICAPRLPRCTLRRLRCKHEERTHEKDRQSGPGARRGGCGDRAVYNIPAGVSSLAAGAGDRRKSLLPGGALRGRTDFGTPGYGGPCPPPGRRRRYYLRLYALKVTRLDVPADATAAYIGFTVRSQSLAKAELMGVYGR